MECPTKPSAHGLANRSKRSLLLSSFWPISFAILYRNFRGATTHLVDLGNGIWNHPGLRFGNMAAPVLIEPIFNKYTPLTDPKIRDPILALARANEIPVQQVFVVDQSRQTKRVSANVSGLAGTTRIALNDNLLNQCTLPEIREVMAHEMGHYVLESWRQDDDVARDFYFRRVRSGRGNIQSRH